MKGSLSNQRHHCRCWRVCRAYVVRVDAGERFFKRDCVYIAWKEGKSCQAERHSQPLCVCEWALCTPKVLFHRTTTLSSFNGLSRTGWPLSLSVLPTINTLQAFSFPISNDKTLKLWRAADEVLEHTLVGLMTYRRYAGTSSDETSEH